MKKLGKRLHLKPNNCDDVSIMYQLRNKKTFTGFKSYDNFDCLAFKHQTVTFNKPKYLGFVCTGIFWNTYI